jgi:hypothetical protein
MFLMGGQLAAGTHLNDVYRSADGITWTQMTANAAWADRSWFGLLSYGGYMFLFGGTPDSGATAFNDVYRSSDGITWTEMIASAAWSDRLGMGAIVHNSKMWCIGGTIAGGVDYNEVWTSTDGITWTQVSSVTALSVEGHSFSTFATYNDIFKVGGVKNNPAEYMDDAWETTEDISAVVGTIRHSVLAEFELHEPKGVSAAVIDSVFVANGAGSGSWIAHPKASSTPSGGGAGVPAAVTLTVPTDWTAGTMVCSGNATDVGVTVATGPLCTVTRDTTHVYDAHYEVTVSQTNASAQDIYVTWKKNSTTLAEFTQIVSLAQNIKAQVVSNILISLADGDTLRIVYKVAAGNIAIDNAYVTLNGLPPQVQ